MRLLAAIAISIAVSLPLAAASDVAALAASYANPTLGASSKVVELQIVVSNMTFTLHVGTAAPVLAGDETIGLFFSGTGNYSYRSTDPIERSLVLFEAAKLDRKTVKVDDAVLVNGAFDTLFLRARGIPLPSLTAGGALTDLKAAFEGHRDQFANAYWSPASHLLIQQQEDERAAPVAVAEMGGGAAHGYVLDPIETKEERFYALVTQRSISTIAKELRGALFPVVIAQQPVGRTRTAFLQPRYLLVEVDYTLVGEGTSPAAKLSVTETVVPRRVAQSVFRFNLLSGRWDDATFRRFKVDQVTDANGKKLPFDFDRGSLLVSLPAKVAVNDAATIRFEISGDFLFRPGGDSFWQLGIEPWFPQPDANGGYFTLHSIVKVRKPWIAFATGNTVARREEGDYNVLESALDKPSQFAVAHAGRYDVVEEKEGPLTIRIASYAGKNEIAAKKLPKVARQIIAFYEQRLGPFPFTEYNIIEMNDLGWGQAPPGMMFITKEAFNPNINLENRLYAKGVTQRFAHEIAHQYWGVAVRTGSEEEEWIRESFSELCSALVVKEIDGQRAYDKMVIDWMQEARKASSVAPVALGNRVSIPSDPLASWDYRRQLVYDKGAYLLAVLRKQVGDEKFFLLLRNLQGQYAWRYLTTTDIAKLMGRIDPGQDYQRFFDRHIWSNEMPQMPK